MTNCCLCGNESKHTHRGKSYCGVCIYKVTVEAEVYTRCVGYIRPKKQYNKGKLQEVKERKMYNVDKAIEHASQTT